MNATGTSHLTDADVIRHLDREGPPDEAARRDAHLRGCHACAERRDALAANAARVSEWLLRADAAHATTRPAGDPGHDRLRLHRPARRSWPRFPAATPWLRAAAIVLLLAAPLAALQPVRQWVAERVGLAPAEPVTATARATDPDAGTAIRFAPAAGALTVSLDAAAPGAVLRIARSDEAILFSPGGAPGPVVAAEVVRLPAGEAGAGLDWLLAVPATVDEVVVRVGGATVRVAGAEIDAGAAVDLAVNR